MYISNEIMVLFGGTLVLLQLRRRRNRAKKRPRGMVIIAALLIESITLVVGLSVFLLGVSRLLP